MCIGPTLTLAASTAGPAAQSRCFSARLMAGLDGIKNKIDPGAAMDKDLYDLPPEELDGIPMVCASLCEAMDSLAADHDVLLAGDVFTKDLIEG